MRGGMDVVWVGSGRIYKIYFGFGLGGPDIDITPLTGALGLPESIGLKIGLEFRLRKPSRFNGDLHIGIWF
jgi:hypothetical protein